MKNLFGNANQAKMNKLKKPKTPFKVTPTKKNEPKVEKQKWPHSSKLLAAAVAQFKTKTEMAQLMGTCQSFIDTLLRGAKPIPAWHAAKISAATTISFSQFVDAHLHDAETMYLQEANLRS